MMFLILTEAQADTVRGASGASAALDPRPLANGTEWALPVRVASDPAHAARHALLSTLPIRAVGPEEWASNEA